ncbi:MAG: GNAT family N-acetyltransferase [Ferruginibacter sp.]
MPNIILETTPAQIGDADQFFEIFKDTDIRNIFHNLRFNSVEEVKQYLKFQINDTTTSRLSFFKSIRISFTPNIESYTCHNSILIGFICNHEASSGEFLASGGLQQNISFAISSLYRGKGFMTNALDMTLDAMIQDGFNFVPALVKSWNKSSIRVLEKCGFDKVRHTQMGLMYAKRLTMDEIEYKKIFNL